MFESHTVVAEALEMHPKARWVFAAYHLRGCVHLLGRENEPLPVGEAIELGFTPCSVCEPNSAILAAARRV